MSSCCSFNCGCASQEAPSQESPVRGVIDVTTMKVGDSAVVRGFRKGGQPAYIDKLLAMGLIRGTKLTVTRRAPLGDPVDFRIRNYHLTLRKDEAAVLLLEASA